MEKFLSSYGFANSAMNVIEKQGGLKELVHEFCTAFNVKVTHNASNSMEDREGMLLRKYVNVVDNNGFPLGSLRVDKNYNGDKVYVYECDTIVNKAKASANSSQNARDSTKINGLIKSLKTNNEYPRAESTYKHFIQTMGYGFGTLDRDRMQSNINISMETFMGMAHQILGLPSEKFTVDRQELQTYIDNYEKTEAKRQEGLSVSKRFAKGVTVVRLPSGGYRGNNDGFYMIGKGAYDSVLNKPLITEPFVRYDSISDSPLAGLAVMCKTYTSKGNHYTLDNDFGISRNDTYIADLDIVTCFGNSIHLLLIPDNAE